MAVDLGSVYAALELNNRGWNNALKEAEGSLQNFESEGRKSFERVTRSSKILLGGLTALSAGAFAAVSKFTMTAARTETLGIAMEAVAKATGTSIDVLKEQERALNDQGIATQEARQILTGFMQSQLDVADASKVSRVAQDLAVIANQNSSQAAETLTRAISSQSGMLLRQYGITKTANQIFEEYAGTVGKTADELDNTEKKQAFLNIILAEGEKVAGTYEAAMDTVGKKIGSLDRHIQHATAAIGERFLPVLGVGVDALTKFLEQITPENIDKFIEKIKEFEVVVWGLVGALTAALLPAIFSIGKAIIAAAISFGAPLIPFLLVGAALGTLVGLFIKSKGGINALKEAAETLVWALGDWEERNHALSPTLQKIGEVVASIMDFINRLKGAVETLIWALGDWEIRNDSLSPKLQKIGEIILIVEDFIKRAIAAVKTLVWAFGDWEERNDQLSPKLQKVGEAIVKVKDFIFDMWEKIKSLVNKVREFVDLLLNWEEGQEDISAEMEIAIWLIRDMWDGIKDIWETIKKDLLPALKGLYEALFEDLNPETNDTIDIIKKWAKILGGALLVAIGIIINGINFFIKVISLLINVVSFLVTAIRKAVRFLIDRFNDWHNAWKAVIDAIIGFFENLYNELVGNSIIPDLVNDITDWIGKLPSMVGEKLKDLLNVFDDWFGKMWESAKNTADNIRERISNAFNVKERNSPSILDRLQELKAASESVMGNIQVPNFAGDISSSLASINPQIGGNLAVSGGSPNLTVNVGMYAGSALEKRQIAKELNEALADYEKGVGLTI